MIDNRWVCPRGAGHCLLAVLALLTLCCSPATSDLAAPNATDAPPPASSSTVPEDPPAEATAPADEKKPLHNRLRWETASEVDNFGFDIYRAAHEEGPFTRLTEDPIPGAGTVDEPQQYEWIDDTNDPTRGYYYYVESISMSNQRENFTPVFYAKPKQPADAG